MSASRQDGRQRVGDAILPFDVSDQVLADFQFQIVQAAWVGVTGDREVRAVHRIGLVVAHILPTQFGQALQARASAGS